MSRLVTVLSRPPIAGAGAGVGVGVAVVSTVGVGVVGGVGASAGVGVAVGAAAAAVLGVCVGVGGSVGLTVDVGGGVAVGPEPGVPIPTGLGEGSTEGSGVRDIATVGLGSSGTWVPARGLTCYPAAGCQYKEAHQTGQD